MPYSIVTWSHGCLSEYQVIKPSSLEKEEKLWLRWEFPGSIDMPMLVEDLHRCHQHLTMYSLSSSTAMCEPARPIIFCIMMTSPVPAYAID